MMTLNTLKNHFKETLENKYPIEEINSFYYLLLAHFMKLKRVDIALDPNQLIQKVDLDKLTSALNDLSQEIPIQYIMGNTEFFGLQFFVNENVLIPRTETEELVAWVITSTLSGGQTTILDIGTGSGCIAISLAKNLPNAKVFAIDVSKDVLNVAKQNANLNEVDVQFIKQDILTSTSLNQQYDIIVSNPPYVRELEKKEIKNNVLVNEPHLALFVKDNNPLLFYDKIADLAMKYLKPDGQLFFEINQYLGNETVELLKQKNFQNIELRKDIFGNHRMIKATNYK